RAAPPRRARWRPHAVPPFRRGRVVVADRAAGARRVEDRYARGLRRGGRRPRGCASVPRCGPRLATADPAGRLMEPRVSLITLGVADLSASRAFYEQLGWQGQETEETVFFQAGAMVVVLWGRAKLAADAQLPDLELPGFRGVALAHNVRSEQEGDQIIAAAEQAGATVTRPAGPTFSGGYAAAFTGPAGLTSEIRNNTTFPL